MEESTPHKFCPTGAQVGCRTSKTVHFMNFDQVNALKHTKFSIIMGNSVAFLHVKSDVIHSRGSEVMGV